MANRAVLGWSRCSQGRCWSQRFVRGEESLALSGGVRWLVCTFLLVLASCGSSRTTIRHVLPDGLRGAFVLRVSETTRDYRVRNGLLLLVWPEEGVLNAGGATEDVLLAWHVEEFVDKEGRALTDVAQGGAMIVSGSGDTFYWYYRGSKQAQRDFLHGHGMMREAWLRARGLIK